MLRRDCSNKSDTVGAEIDTALAVPAPLPVPAVEAGGGEGGYDDKEEADDLNDLR